MKWEGQQESENVEDRRGMSKKGIAIGGGAGALLLMVVGYFLGVDPQMLDQLVNNPQGGGQQNPGQQRQLTPDEQRSQKFAATILKFTEVVWDKQFRAMGKQYEPPHMVLFSDRVDTGCGSAPSAVGPFYCPADRKVYLDPTFFDDLERKLGGSKADFSKAYVIAHEVGHHVQNLLGYSKKVDQKRRTLSEEEYNKWSVRLELQADYLAGVWAHYGQREFGFMEKGDIESAFKTAKAIGDDRLQHQHGFDMPEKYTHGTSEQRVRWFRKGLETGNMEELERIFEMPYNKL